MMRLLQRRNKHVESAKCLGWAGIGIGVAQIAAPRLVSKLLGLQPNCETTGVLRVLGIREIMQGVGIVGEEHADGKLQAGLWARVAGDVLDGALLAAAATKTKNPVGFAAVSTAVIGIAVMDLLAANKLEVYRSRWWR